VNRIQNIKMVKILVPRDLAAEASLSDAKTEMQMYHHVCQQAQQ
jgi:hypothetical protein